MAIDKEDLGLDWSLMRAGERHLDRHNFDDLLTLASEMCLEQPLRYENNLPSPGPEEVLLRKLGLRGLSTALDILEYAKRIHIGPSTDEDGRDLLSVTSPLRAPEQMGVEPDAVVQQKIEAFGAALLDEAYLSLGTEVRPKIRAFKEAQTDEEQIAVLAWLDNRVAAFDKTASVALKSDDEQFFYHPARLSPRLIGRYPHNSLDPTCLGKSILTASFVHQTGAETLHAGILKTPREESIETLAEILFGLSSRKDLGVTSQIRERLLAKGRDLFTHPDMGFHAVSLVQLQSGAWYVLDPNFKASMKLSEQDSEQLGRAHADIHGFGPGVKGIERTIMLRGPQRELASYALVAWVAFENMQPLEFDAESIAARLVSVEADELLPFVRQYIHDTLLQPFEPDDDTPDMRVDSARKLAHLYNDEKIWRASDAHPQSLFADGMEDAIEKFLLWDESPEAIVSRLRHDAGYRERKLEDLRALPYLLLANCALIAYDAIDDRGAYAHESLEVGATSYRIGAAVLSDVASYCGNALSYSFWLSHWPSRIPLTERLGDVAEHESSIRHNSMGWLDTVLRYSKQNGIIQ